MFITIRQQIKFVEIFSGKLRPYWRTISQFYHCNLNFFRQVIRENLSDRHKNYKTLLIGTSWITSLMFRYLVNPIEVRGHGLRQLRHRHGTCRSHA